MEHRDNENEELLATSCKEGNLWKVQSILEADPSLLNKGISKSLLRSWEKERSWPVLMIAAWYGHTEIFRYLLTLPEIQINQTDIYRYTVLHISSYNNKVDCVSLLLQHPEIKINQSYWKGTALHIACEQKATECVSLLVQHPKIDVNSQKAGNTALHIACKQNSIDCASLLLQHPEIEINSQNGNKETALHTACEGNATGCVLLLVQHPKIDVNSQNWRNNTALHIACERKSVDCASLLLQHPQIDVNLKNTREETALHIAFTQGATDCFSLLLQHPQIDVNLKNSKGETPLLQAFRSSKTGSILSLLQHAADVNIQNNNGETSLHFAALRSLDYVSLLLQQPDINVNIQDTHGDTALHRAFSAGKTECVKVLLQHPMTNISIKNNAGYTVLYTSNISDTSLLLNHIGENESTRKKRQDENVDIASILNKPDCLFLLQSLPNINFRNEDGETALHFAVSLGKEDCISVLLQCNEIDVNSVNNVGGTALHRACSLGNAEFVKLLLKHPQINVNIQNEKGNTPFHLAVQNDEQDCTELLSQHATIDGTILNNDGVTALELKTEIDKIAPLLQSLEMTRWNRSKIMLVGQGRAGKTALANNLMGRLFEEETASTIGAEEMEVQMYYGRVKNGRLQKSERMGKEFEGHLMEISKTVPILDEKTSGNLGSESVIFSSPTKPLQRCSSELHAVNDTADIVVRECATNDRNYAQLTVQTIPVSGFHTKKPKSSFTDHQVDVTAIAKFRKSTSHSAEEDRPSYTISLYDFGGQSVFNVLHPFFMSRYGVYLLVFDMTLFLSEDAAKRASCHKELKFWLNSLAMHTYDMRTRKTAAVALIGTRKDLAAAEKYREISQSLEAHYRGSEVWGSLIRFKASNDARLLTGKETWTCASSLITISWWRITKRQMRYYGHLKRAWHKLIK